MTRPMIRYKLREASPEFRILSGPSEGMEYRHGRDYDLDDIPAQDTGMRWMFVFSGFGAEADEGRE